MAWFSHIIITGKDEKDWHKNAEEDGYEPFGSRIATSSTTGESIIVGWGVRRIDDPEPEASQTNTETKGT